MLLFRNTEITRCGAAAFWSADTKMLQSAFGSSAGNSDKWLLLRLLLFFFFFFWGTGAVKM